MFTIVNCSIYALTKQTKDACSHPSTEIKFWCAVTANYELRKKMTPDGDTTGLSSRVKTKKQTLDTKHVLADVKQFILHT